MAYGARHYGGGGPAVVASAPAGSGALDATADRTRTASATLTATRALSATAARTRTASATISSMAYGTPWTADLSQSGWRSREASGELSVQVPIEAPPAGVQQLYVKRVSLVFPAPTLGPKGRPQ